MHKKYSTFLILSFVGVSIFGVYSYFYNDLKSEAASSDRALTSSLDTSSSMPSSSDNKTNEDTAFLMKLVSLEDIHINTDLFENPSFKLLVDNSIKLEPVAPGRVNPFSPVRGTQAVQTNSAPVVLVKTKQAVMLTDKSAVLTGALEGVASNNIYFDYGPTINLGKTTPKLNPSLIGEFSSAVLGLSSKTTYFFRAVASINGATVYGEIISFKTN